MKNFRKLLLKSLNLSVKFIRDALNVEKKYYYLILFLISFTVFFVVLFPYGNIAVKKMNSVKSSAFRQLSVYNADLNIIGDSSIQKITVIFQNGSRLDIPELLTDISFISLYFGKTADCHINAEKFSYYLRNTGISGKLNSKINFRFNDKFSPVTGELTLNLESLLIENVSFKGFDFEKISIKSLGAKIVYESGMISIKDFMFAGKDLSGKIRGTIRLNQSFRNSSIDLQIDISASSSVLKDFEMFLNQYINPDTNSIALSLSGTISTPSINLKKSQ